MCAKACRCCWQHYLKNINNYHRRFDVNWLVSGRYKLFTQLRKHIYISCYLNTLSIKEDVGALSTFHHLKKIINPEPLLIFKWPFIQATNFSLEKFKCKMTLICALCWCSNAEDKIMLSHWLCLIIFVKLLIILWLKMRKCPDKVSEGLLSSLTLLSYFIVLLNSKQPLRLDYNLDLLSIVVCNSMARMMPYTLKFKLKKYLLR